jgi:protein ImuB
LPLALAESPDTGPSTDSVSPLRHLWFGIYLPALPLEALLDTTEAAAVFEERQGVRKILLANRQAMAEGIGPGMAINAALALSPSLRLEERNLAREARVLRELAEWTGKFTSCTAIEPPSLLLLEIAGSLNLFGGIRALRQRIVRGLNSQGFAAGVALAPVPLAATWLARAGQSVCIRDPRNLVGKLGPLPLACLDWPETVQASLKGMGITTIAEMLRLPRQGFARRFGATRLLELDRALGKLPDPRVSYRSPEQFITDFDLNEEQSDAGLLLQACRELLMQLERFLLSRQMAVQHIEFSFFHLQAPATHLGLGCVRADRAVRHWFDLLEIKFDRLALPAPAIAIRLSAGHGQSFTAQTGVLSFSREAGKCREYSLACLAERLAARIGDQSVHGIRTVAEHRPQHAWQAHSSYDDVPHCQHGPAFHVDPHVPELLTEIRRTNSLVLQRPLWILREPELLEHGPDGPRYDGKLRLTAGPERLETGWWDDDGIARDYFVAVNPGGVHLWIYRDRGKDTGRWYLHGMFG